MTIRSFADTSAVSLAYAMSDAANQAELAPATDFTYMPYTTEGFTMSKESQTSTAIRGNRRTSGSKNTRGSAAGASTIEFGSVQFTLDMLQLLMMNDWLPVDETDADAGQYIIDSNSLQHMVVEKAIKTGGAPTDRQDHERYFGVTANDGTLDFGDAALITLATNYIGFFADTASAAQGVNGLGGSMATAKLTPDDYEIADSSNNLKSIVITDAAGTPLEMTFQTAQLQIQNNAREQNGLGSVFASGIAIGKVNVQLTGDVYYYDQTVLNAHMNNQRLKGSFTIETREGTFYFYFPNMMVQAPSSNSQGENQDFTTSLTLVSEEGQVELVPGTEVACSLMIKYVPKP